MEIIIKSRKYGQHLVLIDEGDYDAIKGNTLYLSKKANGFYVMICLGGNKSKPLHSYLMKPPNGLMIDHKNRNGLDNRRENIRIATKAQNSYNKFDEKKSTSKFKGVYWAKDKDMWCARITLNDKVIAGGYFKCKIDAAHRYNELAMEHFGDFAYLNKFTEEDLKNRRNDPVWNGRKRCSAGYKGVYKAGNVWVAHIRENGKKVHIGCYKTSIEAADAFNKEAISFFGEGTFLNKLCDE